MRPRSGGLSRYFALAARFSVRVRDLETSLLMERERLCAVEAEIGSHTVSGRQHHPSQRRLRTSHVAVASSLLINRTM